MVVLYIILGLLALIALLLFMPICITVDYAEKLTAKLSFLGIRFDLSKERKPKKSIKASKEKKGKKEKPGALRELFEGKSFLENLKLIIALLRGIMPQIKYVLRHTRVRRFNLDIKIANADAAKTALEYGAACAAVYPFLSWAQSFTDISMEKVNVLAAFGEEKCSASAHLKIKIRVIILLMAIIKLLPIYQKLTEDKNNERKKHKCNN